MTMIAVLLGADSAIVVADSACCYGHRGAIVIGDDGQPLEDQKIVPLRGFVLTLLGRLDLREYASRHARELQGIDEAIERLPAILRAGARALGERIEGAPQGAGGNTALVIGWSQAKQQMLLVTFGAADGFVPETYGPGSFWRNPDAPGADPFAIPAGRSGLIEWVHRCCKGLRVLDPNIAVGGRLQIADITKGSIMLGTAGNLGFPAMVLAAALAGCGGGEAEEAHAGQLSGQSATNTQTDSPADGSVVDSNGGSATTVNPSVLSYTNNSADPITMQVEADFQAWQTLTGSAVPGAGSVGVTTYVNGASVASKGMPLLSATQTPFAMVAQFTLAPGELAEAKLVFQAWVFSGIGTATVFWTGATLRMTAIKK